MKEAVSAIRKLQRGESVTVERDEFELHDASLDYAPARTSPIYIAGRGPQILSLGGHYGDGVIAGAGLTSVQGMEYAIDRIALGANRREKSIEDIDIVCWAFLSIAGDREVALDAVTPLVARIVQAVPTDTLQAIGVPRDDAERVKGIDQVDKSSPQRLREMVPRAVVEQFSIAGTPKQCLEHVYQLLEIGVDHIAVLPFENKKHGDRGNLQMFSNEVLSVVNND